MWPRYMRESANPSEETTGRHGTRREPVTDGLQEFAVIESIIDHSCSMRRASWAELGEVGWVEDPGMEGIWNR
jgi:hypothetical protein